jgi:hypothetical protein
VVAFFLIETAPRKRRDGNAQTQPAQDSIGVVIARNGDA